ncbi:MAG: hypothetical protein WCJ64_07685 [Rhodospirillaceae bacterium]
MSKTRRPKAAAAHNPPSTPAEEAIILGIAKTMAVLIERGDAIAQTDEAHQKVHDEETQAIVFEVYRSIQPIWNNETLLRRTLSALSLPTNKKNLQAPPYGFIKKALRRDKSQWTRYSQALCAAHTGIPHPENGPMTADEFELEVQRVGGLKPFHDAYVPKTPRVRRDPKPSDSPGDAAAVPTPQATITAPAPANSNAALVSRSPSIYEFPQPLPDGAIAQLDRPLFAIRSRKVVAYGHADEHGVAIFCKVSPADDDEAAFETLEPRSPAGPKLLVAGADIDDFALDLLQMVKDRRGETFVVDCSTNGIAVAYGDEQCWLDPLDAVDGGDDDGAGSEPERNPAAAPEASPTDEQTPPPPTDAPAAGGSVDASPSDPAGSNDVPPSRSSGDLRGDVGECNSYDRGETAGRDQSEPRRASSDTPPTTRTSTGLQPVGDGGDHPVDQHGVAADAPPESHDADPAVVAACGDQHSAAPEPEVTNQPPAREPKPATATPQPAVPAPSVVDTVPSRKPAVNVGWTNPLFKCWTNSDGQRMLDFMGATYPVFRYDGASRVVYRLDAETAVPCAICSLPATVPDDPWATGDHDPDPEGGGGGGRGKPEAPRADTTPGIDSGRPSVADDRNDPDADGGDGSRPGKPEAPRADASKSAASTAASGATSELKHATADANVQPAAPKKRGRKKAEKKAEKQPAAMVTPTIINPYDHPPIERPENAGGMPLTLVSPPYEVCFDWSEPDQDAFLAAVAEAEQRRVDTYRLGDGKTQGTTWPIYLTITARCTNPTERTGEINMHVGIGCDQPFWSSLLLPGLVSPGVDLTAQRQEREFDAEKLVDTLKSLFRPAHQDLMPTKKGRITKGVPGPVMVKVGLEGMRLVNSSNAKSVVKSRAAEANLPPASYEPGVLVEPFPRLAHVPNQRLVLEQSREGMPAGRVIVNEAASPAAGGAI